MLGGVMCGDNGGGAVQHCVVGESHGLVDHRCVVHGHYASSFHLQNRHW